MHRNNKKKKCFMYIYFGIIIIFLIFLFSVYKINKKSNVIKPQGTDQYDNIYVLKPTEENIIKLIESQINSIIKMAKQNDIKIVNEKDYINLIKNNSKNNIVIFKGYDGGKNRIDEIISNSLEEKGEEYIVSYKFKIKAQKAAYEKEAEYGNNIDVSYKGKNNEFTFENAKFLKDYLKVTIGNDLNLTRVEEIINELAKYDDGIVCYTIDYEPYKIIIRSLGKTIEENSINIRFRIQVVLQWIE